MWCVALNSSPVVTLEWVWMELRTLNSFWGVKVPVQWGIGLAEIDGGLSVFSHLGWRSC